MEMNIEIVLEILLVWFIIGIVIGGWISIDTFRRKVEGARWVAAGVFLTVIGLALYIYMRKKAMAVKSPVFRPAPEFHYPEKTASDVPSEPATQTPMEPAITPVGCSPYESWAPVIKDQIEGPPRCPKCGSAARTIDEFCSECGARLKGQ